MFNYKNLVKNTAVLGSLMLMGACGVNSSAQNIHVNEVNPTSNANVAVTNSGYSSGQVSSRVLSSVLSVKLAEPVASPTEVPKVTVPQSESSNSPEPEAAPTVNASPTEAPAPVDNSIKGSTYVIQSGDTVSSVADRANTTVSEIARCSNIDVNNVTVGQTITLHCDAAPQQAAPKQNTQDNQEAQSAPQQAAPAQSQQAEASKTQAPVAQQAQAAPSQNIFNISLPAPHVAVQSDQQNILNQCGWLNSYGFNQAAGSVNYNGVMAISHNYCDGGRQILQMRSGDIVHMTGWSAGDYKVVGIIDHYSDNTPRVVNGAAIVLRTCEPGTSGGDNRVVVLQRV